ncbi:hypothetical protein IQ219_12355 [Synechocystis sp. LEGE 06083]|uniref:hypothetical protein n=1 Tax=Synechocystis sp. LEGE 06083 TaxID=915336 RepID=UPI00187EAE58|nr:hypothetical protein [Synechocystis sp. LEGE 06083]MBE9196080.1 hypothetical protein [Synechocystis sp. LEGE 06083]
MSKLSSLANSKKYEDNSERKNEIRQLTIIPCTIHVGMIVLPWTSHFYRMAIAVALQRIYRNEVSFPE